MAILSGNELTQSRPPRSVFRNISNNASLAYNGGLNGSSLYGPTAGEKGWPNVICTQLSSARDPKFSNADGDLSSIRAKPPSGLRRRHSATSRNTGDSPPGVVSAQTQHERGPSSHVGLVLKKR